jgi:hypothetical protein
MIGERGAAEIEASAGSGIAGRAYRRGGGGGGVIGRVCAEPM